MVLSQTKGSLADIYNRSNEAQPWCPVLKSEDIMLAIVLLDALKLFVVICYLRIMNY